MLVNIEVTVILNGRVGSWRNWSALSRAIHHIKPHESYSFKKANGLQNDVNIPHSHCCNTLCSVLARKGLSALLAEEERDGTFTLKKYSLERPDYTAAEPEGHRSDLLPRLSSLGRLGRRWQLHHLFAQPHPQQPQRMGPAHKFVWGQHKVVAHTVR